ncbi:MAG TPA: hypothetical protein VIW27_02405 [Gammaproteobacteria bacterium]|jgi:hypothetical protein
MKAIAPISTKTLVSLLLLLVLQACAGSGARIGDPDAEQARDDQLGLAILSLGDDIDPDEARRAARVAIDYSHQLAREYDIVGPPLFHNTLVNLGIRDRGLCVHWARDLMIRLQQERFRSLDLHWGVANYESAFRVEHNTVIISARGDALQQGLVLDPWRYSGDLYWAPAHDDPDYVWRPHAEIQVLKDRRAELRQSRGVQR